MSVKSIRQATIIAYILIFTFSIYNQAFSQSNPLKYENYEYRKKEFNLGFHFETKPELEELRTDEWRQYEEITNNTLKFQLKNRSWNFLDLKQEQFELDFEAGPLWGKGNWVDSSSVADIEADHKIAGLRINASAGYTLRYYYQQKSYTMLQVNGWARYDLYKQTSTGISTDTNGVAVNYNNKSHEGKARYNVNAKAGWGMGKLEPMNNYMVADYILKKYYSNTNFSKAETEKLAEEVGKIKGQRSIKKELKPDIEIEKLLSYINQKMFQIPVSAFEEDWIYGEFLPRYNGNRVEFGPFFKYFNIEPDFIYGGFIQFEHAKYCTNNWNRNFSAGINYNAYKRQDWLTGEIKIGWSYYFKLRSQFDFGLKYVPGYILNNSSDTNFNNGFIPYFGYYTQVNTKNRFEIKLAYRFSDDKKLMLPGPEFSISVYRSKY